MKSSALNLARTLGGVLALAALVSLGGCAFFEPTPAKNPEPVGEPLAAEPDRTGSETNLAPFKADTIHVGDRVTIIYSGLPVPLPAHEEQVREDGQIKPPLLTEPVLAAGKTVGELQDELHRLYVPDIYKVGTFTVRIPERYFFVGGEVRNPGQKPYLSQMTVVKAIQAAGDFSEFANKRSAIITRADNTTEIVDCKKAIRNPRLDRPIYPGDKIHVPRRPF